MRVLFLSYDGMTDPLGSSQVIPYLQGLARHGHQILILSAEKPDRHAALGPEIAKNLASAGIEWRPIRYHKNPPVLSTLFDVSRMFATALLLRRRFAFGIVHARSYVPALAAWALAKILPARFLFDMRGFWADERVDGGLWNLSRLPYRTVYRFFKYMEGRFLTESHAVVSLTHKGLEEMRRWPAASRMAPVEVIPCCVDTARFSVVDPEEKRGLALRLGIAPGDKILVYLGSLGTWYLLDEMLAFLSFVRKENPAWRFLVVTPDDPSRVTSRLNGLPPEAVIVASCRHAEAPLYLSLAHAGLFFIRPAYSKMSSSPTKLGEMLAMGIPVVANAGVGDVDWIFGRWPVGHLLRDFSPEEMARGARALERLHPSPGIRAAALDYFSLEKGVARYQAIYERLGRASENT
ncbi:MAG: glycosyltransferase [Bdellovibrionales bacterium]|nr:glycosyltransferase [Bdellovibrionales bacterium]